MDYTTLALVKQAMDSQEVTGDTILSDYITKASRLIDRLVTGLPGVIDYFKSETIVNEILNHGVIDYAGRLTVYPHKPVISAVSAMDYRYSLSAAWTPCDVTRVSVEMESVLYEGYLSYSDRIYARISYTGGYGTTVSGLPQDLVDIATLMSVRLYKEARSGLGDSIGVAELGTLTYTKAFPQRAIETLRIYARTAPWI